MRLCFVHFRELTSYRAVSVEFAESVITRFELGEGKQTLQASFYINIYLDAEIY